VRFDAPRGDSREPTRVCPESEEGVRFGFECTGESGGNSDENFWLLVAD
jgi:hypothetical protein